VLRTFVVGLQEDSLFFAFMFGWLDSFYFLVYFFRLLARGVARPKGHQPVDRRDYLAADISFSLLLTVSFGLFFIFCY
jgi:hypothetical protein